MATELSNMVEFYRDRSVFITGGTGFLGKVLVEKLLRSCPELKAIYLLIRPKSGQDVRARIQDFNQHIVRILIASVNEDDDEVVSKWEKETERTEGKTDVARSVSYVSGQKTLSNVRNVLDSEW